MEPLEPPSVTPSEASDRPPPAPAYESERQGFAPPGAGEGEFEDEPPGVVLAALRLTRAALIWSAIELALVLGFAVLGWLEKRELLGPVLRESGLLLPLEIVWNLLAIAAVGGTLAVSFLRLNQVTSHRVEAERATRCLRLLVLSALIWAAARFALGIRYFPDS